MLSITNTTCTFQVEGKLKFSDIHHLCQAKSTKGDRKFKQLVLRVKSPKATALIYESGKIVVLGCKSYEQIDKAVEQICLLIRKSLKGRPVICNAVGSCHIDKIRMDLSSLEKYFRQYYGSNGIPRGSAALYTPETFPGLRLNPSKEDKSPTILLFQSGKAVITGCKTIEEVEEAHEELETVILSQVIESNFIDIKDSKLS